jgi:acetolactate synthase-1/2/3 large subunit
MDSVPLVAITGQVPTTSLGSDSFQEADIYGISIPITKYNYLIKKPQDLPQVLAEAFYLASSGRPGPVLIDVPKDIQTSMIEYSWPGEVSIPGYQPKPVPDPEALKTLAQALTQSLRPLFFIGGGAVITEASSEIIRLAESCQAAMVTSLQAKGAIPDDHPLCLGLPGMHGSKFANIAISESDLVLGLGVRFDDRVVGNVRRFAPLARIAHVDIDAAEIGKRLKVDLPITGDLKTVISLLPELLGPLKSSGWKERLSELKSDYALSVPQATDRILPQAAIRCLSDQLDSHPIVVTDVGQHQMWSAQHIKARQPRSFLSSGGLGTMGFGLPAAIGAQLAKPEAQVVLVTGDGSFQMCIQELGTARQYGLPIKVLVINNGCLGMVRQWQEFFFQKRYSQTVFEWNPDFAALAEVYGFKPFRADKPEAMPDAIRSFLAHPGPALLDMKVDPEENVLPMIPAGQGQTDFYPEDKL